MAPRDARYRRHPYAQPAPVRPRPYYRYLILFALSLYIIHVVRQRSSNTHLEAFKAFEASDDPRPTRNFSIQLHPKDHITRLPTSLEFHWNITKGIRAPDGVNKTVYLVNGHFPGPTLEARTGDQIVVVVQNHLEGNEGIAFHWHGLHLKDANHMDGVVGITQKPIPPGGEFRYKFEISKTQAGTFWYHAHSELQRADGLYGGLVIHRRFEAGVSEAERYDYAEEQLLLVGDWYHSAAKDVEFETFLQSITSEEDLVSPSFLINGLGSFRCSPGIECENVRIPSMKLSPKASRIRIVNVGSNTGFKFTLEGANFRLITVDGGNEIEPSAWLNNIGILHPGERADVVTSGNRASSISITLDRSISNDQPKPQKFSIEMPRGQARRPGTPLAVSRMDPLKHALTTSSLDLSTVRGPEVLEPMPEFAEQTVLIYLQSITREDTDAAPMGYINGTSWIAAEQPLVNVRREDWDEHQFLPYVQANGGWVDMVVNNLDEEGYSCHLHGNTFLLLSQYESTYNPFGPAPFDSVSHARPNLENPPSKDTVYIPGKGYVILRIRADNVGLWFFECGLWPTATGMAMGLDIR